MKKKLILAGAVVLVLSAAPLTLSGVRAGEPPVSGSVQNFDVGEKPLPMPSTPFQNVRGEKRTLADFRGRVILVNFWATWCGGSQRELPTLEDLQSKLGGDSFSVVLVSEDRDGWKVVKRFIKKTRLKMPESYLDVGFKLSRAVSLPIQMGSILIDEKGREVGRLDGHADWNTPEARALIKHYIDKARGAGAS